MLETTLSASGLSVDTTYFIYAYMNGSDVSLEASTTAPTTAFAGGGIPLKTGNATRTLVGMARTITGPAWADTPAQRFVLSYYNRRDIYCKNAFTTGRTTASTTIVEINSEIRNEFLTWDDEAFSCDFSGHGSNNGAAGVGMVSGISLDGTATLISQSSASNPATNYSMNLSNGGSLNTTRGYHYTTVSGYVQSNTGSWASGGALTTRIRG